MENYKYEVSRLLNELNNGTGNLVINDIIRKIDEILCWAWDNWESDLTGYHPGVEKPKFPTESFIDDWVENEDFEADGFDIEELKNL